MPVKNLFDYFESGETLETFLEDFPSVKREKAIALLEKAEKLLFETAH